MSPTLYVVTQGYGFRTSTTAKIVKQHKGMITVKDNQPSGAVFEIVLPLAT